MLREWQKGRRSCFPGNHHVVCPVRQSRSEPGTPADSDSRTGALVFESRLARAQVDQPPVPSRLLLPCELHQSRATSTRLPKLTNELEGLVAHHLPGGEPASTFEPHMIVG